MPFEGSTLIFAMLLLVAVLAVLAKWLRIAYPIVFVIGGGLLALVPGLPPVELQADLVFLLILPPLLFGSGWTTEWRDFKQYSVPILTLATGLVVCTTAIVAYSAHALLAMPLAAAFVLGAVLSPPDAVAAEAIAEELDLPRAMKAILSGESLINDASALVIYRFAIAAVATGTFSLWSATLQFVYVSVAGIALGLLLAMAIGNATVWLRERGLADQLITVTISLVTPFLLYLPAEAIHASGVLATVAGGIYMSRRDAAVFDYESRLSASGVWNLLFFTFNGVVFILIGLQLRSILGSLHDYSAATLVWYGALMSAIVIGVRFAWIFSAQLIRRLLARNRDGVYTATWKESFVMSWCGMRGIVTLAAALAIPYVTSTGVAFPARSLILFLAFFVIVVTLVGQGLTLPSFIRRWNMRDAEDPALPRARARVHTAHAGLAALTAVENSFETPGHWEVAGRLRSYYEQRVAHFQAHVDGMPDPQADAAEHSIDRELRRATYAAERGALADLRRRGDIDDQTYRDIERDIDLAESRLT